MDVLIEIISPWLDPAILGPIILEWSGRIIAALLIFLIGRWAASAISSAVAKAVDRAGIDQTLSRFLANLVYITLLIFVALTALGSLGVSTINFLAILGAAGLAVGLALKDSLANFSSGVMLVIFRPFRVGDFIEAAGVSGTVHSIGIFNTVVKTSDNRVVTVPNSLVFGGTITNYSTEATRRIDLVFGVGYDDNLKQAKELIAGVLEADERILKDPAPTVMLLELADSSVNFAVRPWVNSGDYGSVRADVLERIKKVLEDNGLSIPYPQQDLHIVSQPSGTA